MDTTRTRESDVFAAIHGRRSARQFVERPIPRETIERILDAAVWAPNHKMTEPWGFRVLGPQTQRRYADVRGALKSQKTQDPDAAAAVREKVIAETMRIPVLIAVTCRVDEDPQTREEDYAATFMAIQNMLLAATALGLAGYIRTGRILERQELRDALGVGEGERIVAFLDVGEPAELPQPKPRASAAEKTRWLP